MLGWGGLPQARVRRVLLRSPGKPEGHPSFPVCRPRGAPRSQGHLVFVRLHGPSGWGVPDGTLSLAAPSHLSPLPAGPQCRSPPLSSPTPAMARGCLLFSKCSSDPLGPLACPPRASFLLLSHSSGLCFVLPGPPARALVLRGVPWVALPLWPLPSGLSCRPQPLLPILKAAGPRLLTQALTGRPLGARVMEFSRLYIKISFRSLFFLWPMGSEKPGRTSAPPCGRYPDDSRGGWGPAARTHFVLTSCPLCSRCPEPTPELLLLFLFHPPSPKPGSLEPNPGRVGGLGVLLAAGPRGHLLSYAPGVGKPGAWGLGLPGVCHGEEGSLMPAAGRTNKGHTLVKHYEGDSMRLPV